MYKKRYVRVVVLLILSLSFCCTTSLSQQELLNKTKVYRTLTDEEWDEDILYLKEKIQKIHPDPYRYIQKDELEEMIQAEIDKNYDDPDKRLIGLMGLLAEFNDAHTSLDLRFIPLHRVPLDIKKYKTGYYIIGGYQEQRDIIGKRILEIGGIGIEEVKERLNDIISNETEKYRDLRAAKLITKYEILSGLGIVEQGNKKSVELKVADSSDTLYTELLAEYREEDVNRSDIMSINDKYSEDSSFTGIHYSKVKQPYWYKTIDTLNTLYFQYNRCMDYGEYEKIPLKEMFDRIKSEVESKSIEHFVVDLRNNPGGSSVYFSENITEWIEDKDFKKYVLFGENTFSSGVFAAAEMKLTGAVAYGRETGGKCNHFGQTRKDKLPNSSFIVGISTKDFELMPKVKGGVVPDHIVNTSIQDVKQGTDPVFERVISDIKEYENSKK